MDGFTSAGAAGILYAEDFDEPPLVPAPLSAPIKWELPPPPPPAPVLTEADVDAACIRAVAAAEQAWSENAAERRATALETIAAAVAGARQDAAMQADAVAEGLARTVLGLLAGALPELCRAHGDAEVRALLARLLPVVGRTGPVVVRLHPGLLDTVASDLEALQDGLAETVELRAANLPPGDVRLSWPEGGLTRDTAALRAALTDCLSQLGLLDSAAAPDAAHAIPDTRSPAHVLAH